MIQIWVYDVVKWLVECWWAKKALPTLHDRKRSQVGWAISSAHQVYPFVQVSINGIPYKSQGEQ